jgi:hypothetical protein
MSAREIVVNVVIAAITVFPFVFGVAMIIF